MSVWLGALACVVLGSSCSSSSDGRKAFVSPALERNEFGLLTCIGANESKTCHTHRAIMGVSMGAHGAGLLGLSRPELFDTVGLMGVPMVDWVYMLRNVERSYLGGFCDYETLGAHVDAVDDPNGPAVCARALAEVKITPDGRIMEPEQSYNHWYRWIDEGRGGTFGRNELRASFQDFSRAFGNPSLYNPESPYLPPGVPLSELGRSDEDRCAHPVVLEHFVDRRFNPTGEYPVMTVCDTNTHDGEFVEERAAERPSDILLAVDFNRNGVRDFAEPILFQPHEPYRDEGVMADDDFDWQSNPRGTAANWRYDVGEPFEDVGLDGVPGTHDYGEGNGRFDLNPNDAHFLETNPRDLLEHLPDDQLARLNLWADAGIRDFLASAAATNWFWSSLSVRVGDQARSYDDFDALIAGRDEDYDFLNVDFSPEGIGRHVYVRYGSPDATPDEIARGDGHHVGTAAQVLDRFLSAIAFAESRMAIRDKRRVVGFSVNELMQSSTFYSTALAEERPFSVVLPPGYFDDANQDERYPVLYLLHGQGQTSASLLPTALFFIGHMSDSERDTTRRRGESDWVKFILVLPDSTCSRDACASGNFNANHVGLDGHGPRYQDAFYELMAHVEAHYRTATPEVVENAL